ncbi:hypothetical protein BDV93DRAFT_515298 [Ceratobasidium sp. AG-I]|nr:hypothetical protein BDV93DRAFT_515298 [Ceratobasidium sp. AG-I]
MPKVDMKAFSAQLAERGMGIRMVNGEYTIVERSNGFVGLPRKLRAVKVHISKKPEKGSPGRKKGGYNLQGELQMSNADYRLIYPPAKGAGAGGRRRAADIAADMEATPATPAVDTSTGPKPKKRPVPVPTPEPEPTAGSSHAAGASDNGTIGTSEEASAPKVGKGAAKKKSTKAPTQRSRRSTRNKQAASGSDGA